MQAAFFITFLHILNLVVDYFAKALDGDTFIANTNIPKGKTNEQSASVLWNDTKQADSKRILESAKFTAVVKKIDNSIYF